MKSRAIEQAIAKWTRTVIERSTRSRFVEGAVGVSSTLISSSVRHAATSSTEPVFKKICEAHGSSAHDTVWSPTGCHLSRSQVSGRMRCFRLGYQSGRSHRGQCWEARRQAWRSTWERSYVAQRAWIYWLSSWLGIRRGPHRRATRRR